MTVTTLAREFRRDQLSLLNVGVPRGVWALPSGLWLAGEGRLLHLNGTARCIPFAFPDGEVDQIGEDENGVIAVAGRHWLRIHGDDASQGLEPHEWRVPGGGATAWVDAGFIYRRDARGVRAMDAVGKGDQVHRGPNGAIAVVTPSATRAGPPGRTPRPLPIALEPPFRWSVDGGVLAGLHEGNGARVDLKTLACTTLQGPPVGANASWRGAQVLGLRLVEASSAQNGRWLAGPGGRVWDLAEGRPLGAARVVKLGLTIPTDDGFVTIDWETHQGHALRCVAATRPLRVDRFCLPLDPDDTPIAGVFHEGSVFVETALGEAFEVRGANVVSTSDPPPMAPPHRGAVTTPIGPLADAATTTVDGTCFAWNDAGWLLAWPKDRSAS